jgi:hypothetical protein
MENSKISLSLWYYQYADFLVDTMLVVFSENIGQQTVCIPMRTDWALLFADLFLHFYETDYNAEIDKKSKHIRVFFS